MKKIFCVAISATLALMSQSCSDDASLQPQNVEYDNSHNEILTRSKGGLASDLNTNWENMDNVILSNGTSYMLPWHIGASSIFEYDYRKDIKKEDGWVMVEHSFDDPQYVNSYSNYIALYNQASGDLKIYIESDRNILINNTATWMVYFINPQGWMNGLNEVSLPSSYQFKNSFKWETSVSPIKPASYVGQGWNVITIPNLTYDPNASADNGIQILSHAYNVTYADLFGTTQGEIKGQIITTGTENPTTGLQSSLVTLSKDAAEKWASEILGVSNGGTKGIGELLVSGIGALVKGGASKILNSLFGRFSKSTYNVQDVRLSLKATTSITGKLITPGPTGLPTTAFSIGKNDTGIELGAWNLKENPIIYIHPVGVMCNSFNGIQSDDSQYLFTASGKSKVDIIINPQLLPHVIRYEVECVPVMYSPKNNDQTKLPQIPVADYTYSDYGSLGASEGVTAYLPYTTGRPVIYSDDNFNIIDNNAQGTSTYWRIWNKYGKYSPQMPLYKYIYAPDNVDICRGGEVKVGCKYNYAKVMVTMVTEFEGKRDTVVTSRTYKPRFEWDPEQINNYRGTTMSGLQGKAWSDPVLNRIDNGYYDNLRNSISSYSIQRKDSVELEKD